MQQIQNFEVETSPSIFRYKIPMAGYLFARQRRISHWFAYKNEAYQSPPRHRVIRRPENLSEAGRN